MLSAFYLQETSIGLKRLSKTNAVAMTILLMSGFVFESKVLDAALWLLSCLHLSCEKAWLEGLYFVDFPLGVSVLNEHPSWFPLFRVSGFVLSGNRYVFSLGHFTWEIQFNGHFLQLPDVE